MRVTRISLWPVPLTSHEAYYMADGKACETVETVVVGLDTDAGISGFGEVCPIPHYLPAYARGVAPAVGELAPVVLREEITGPEAMLVRMDGHLKGHRYAKSALDIAIWDAFARRADLPLHALLGGRRQKDLPLYHSITCVDPDRMADMAREAFASGIRQFQAKLGADNEWETDVERLVRVREAVGAGPLVYGDWNCGASQLTATRVGRAVAHLDIMLEQPCATIAECAAVKAATGLPMKLDETAHDIDSLLNGHRRRCMDAVAIKLSKFGGLTRSRQARDLCTQLGAAMCVEDTWGSDITTAALLHLAASTPANRLMNTCDLSGYVAPRLAPEGPIRQNGRIAPPDGPGLGIAPDLDKLGQPDAIFD